MHGSGLWSPWMAMRYLFARKRGYAAFINWVSFIGLTLGVLILTVVVSVMNGFDAEITRRLLNFAPHATVTDPAGSDGPTLDEHALARVAALPDVVAVNRHFQGEAMVVRHGAVNPLVIFGIEQDSLASLSGFTDNIVRGDAEDLFVDAAAAPIALGEPLARGLGYALGDPVVLIFSTPKGTGVAPHILRFSLAATFGVGADPDYTMALVPRSAILERGLAAGGLDGWRITLAEPLAIEEPARAIATTLGPEAQVSFWADEFGTLFRAVKIEKTIMFLLLGLIVAIATFNVVATQAMLVNDKRRDAAILLTMGTPRRALLGIFYIQGAVIAALGVGCGLVLGIAIAIHADAVVSVVEDFMGASIIDGTYFASIPSEVRTLDLAIIVLLSLGLTSIAVLHPALRAVRANPAESLHL